MNLELLAILQDFLSDDERRRLRSEERIKELFITCEEFPIEVCNIIASNDISLEERQMAAVVLKNFIVERWVIKNRPYEVQFHQTKATVRDVIFQGLSDDKQQIRAVTANAISVMMEYDSPGEWSHCFERLFTLIKHGSFQAVDGALLVIIELMNTDSFNLEDADGFFVDLIPLLHNLLTYHTKERNLDSYSINSKIIQIFNEYFEVITDMFEVKNIALSEEPRITECIQQWLETFKIILQDPIDENYELKNQCIECISKLYLEAPELVENHLTDIHHFIQEDIFQLLQIEDAAKSKLVCRFLNFVNDTLTANTVQLMLMHKQNATQSLEKLLWLLLRCMQMSCEDVLKIQNGNVDFLIEEILLDKNTSSIRYTAKRTWKLIVHLLGKHVINVVEQTVSNFLVEVEDHKSDLTDTWWKAQEACLYCISSLSEYGIFDLEGFLGNIVVKRLTSYEGYPVLKGRAFTFITLFIKKLPTELAHTLVKMIGSEVGSQEHSVRISALYSLYQLKQYTEFYSCILPYQVTMMELACSLIPHLHSSDSLSFALDTLNFSINIASEVSVQYEHAFIPIYFESWHQQCRFGSAGTQIVIQQSLEELASNEMIHPYLCIRALPMIKEMITTSDNDIAIYRAAIELLNTLLQHDGTSSIEKRFVDDLFIPVINLVSVCQADKELTKLLQTSLKLYVIKDAERLIEWHDPETSKSGIEHIVAYICKLLNKLPKNMNTSHTEENEITGDIILALVMNVGGVIYSVLPELLYKILERVNITSSRSTQESYIMIFAHLIIHQQEAALMFLENTKLGDKNGFEVVVPLWLEFSENFTNEYSNKASAIALSILYSESKNYPSLQMLQVKGDMVFDANRTGVQTRSQAKKNPEQHVRLSLETKIIKILSNELLNIISNDGESNQLLFDDDDADEDEDDWGDDDEDDLEVLESVTGFSLENHFLQHAEFQEMRNDRTTSKSKIVVETNLKAYLIEFFQAISKDNRFEHHTRHELSKDELLAIELVL